MLPTIKKMKSLFSFCNWFSNTSKHSCEFRSSFFYFSFFRQLWHIDCAAYSISGLYFQKHLHECSGWLFVSSSAPRNMLPCVGQPNIPSAVVHNLFDFECKVQLLVLSEDKIHIDKWSKMFVNSSNSSSSVINFFHAQ
jgi:hypothetical protein